MALKIVISCQLDKHQILLKLYEHYTTLEDLTDLINNDGAWLTQNDMNAIEIRIEALKKYINDIYALRSLALNNGRH